MTLAQQVIALARRNGTLTQAERGHLDALLDRHINVDSPDQLNWFLYGRAKRGDLSIRIPATCDFAEQYRREKGRRSDKTTANAEALLTLYRQYQEWECAACGRRTTPERVTCSGCGKKREAEPVGPDKRIDLCLRLSALLTERGTLSAPIDADNHIRSSINLATTETQRHGSYKSNLNTGYALHTTTADHKHLFLAGDGYVMGSIDLAGADGWTIAAECKLCGDDVMLEDLRAGLKPAQAVALLYLHGQQVNSWPRERVLALVPEVKSVGWLYPASKKVIWSTCLNSRHEVLTHYGWQRLSHLPNGWPIVTWKGGRFRWSVPRQVVHLNYTGKMHRFVGNAFDLEATADHRMPYCTKKGLGVCSAQEMQSRKGLNLPMSGQWIEGRPEPLARLIAAIQSDGHYTEKRGLQFTFRKPRKVARIQMLLNEAGIRYTVAVYFSRRDKVHETVVRCQSAPVVPKQAGPWLLEWNRDSLAAYVDEYTHWDGSFGKTGTRTVFSVHKEHLMWLGVAQRLTEAGFTYQGAWFNGKGRPGHRLSLNKRAFADLDSMKCLTRRVTNAKVHCVETEDGFFLVRHKDKIMITGNCYGSGPLSISAQILKESYGDTGVPLYVEPRLCGALQDLVHARYRGVRWRQNWLRATLQRDGVIEAPNGSRREFFGDRKDHATEREAFAYSPQVMTTYCTELAWHRLWYDPENHESSEPVVQPLLLVHDSLVCRWRRERTAWALARLRTWFDNTLTIAGAEVRVPFSGHYGDNWACASNLPGHAPLGEI